MPTTQTVSLFTAGSTIAAQYSLYAAAAAVAVAVLEPCSGEWWVIHVGRVDYKLSRPLTKQEE